MSIHNYHHLSENKPRTVKPITVASLQSKTKKSSSWFFGSSQKKVKPVVFNKKSYQEEFYEKYGIVYSNNDLGSCLQSLF